MKLRAIFCCLYFGITPWWFYQKEKHYDGTYLNHLKLNLQYAKLWITNSYTEDDIKFENRFNPNWKSVIRNTCCFTYRGSHNE